MSARLLAGVLLTALFCYPLSLRGETVQLRSGKEFQIVDGKISEKDTAEIFHDAEEMLKEGMLATAGEYWQLVIDRGRGAFVAKAKSARANLQGIEDGSFLILRNGEILKGKVKANLRADLLGLEGKEEIPIGRVQEIAAEYHPGYSFVSKTFYPLTLLEIKFRNGELKTSRIAREVSFTVVGADGSVTQTLLGKEYEILRPEKLAEQIDKLTAERVQKIVIYPDLRRRP